MSRRVVSLFAAVVAAAVVVVWALSPAGSPVAAPERAPAGWPATGVWFWRLEWASSAALNLDSGQGAARFVGGSRVEGVLRGRALGEEAGRTRVGFSLVSADVVEVTLNEQPARDAAGLRSALLGSEVVAVFMPDGALEGLRFLPDAAPMLQNFMRGVLGDGQQSNRPGSTWLVEETTPRGRARARYERVDEAVRRRREEYLTVVGLGRGATVVKLESDGRATFRDDGAWSAVSLTERLVARTPDGREQVAATFLSLSPAAAVEAEAVGVEALLAQAGPARPTADVTPALDVEQQMLRQRIDGLTHEALIEGVFRFGGLPASNEKHRFALRASGLLLAQPALCLEVAKVLSAPGIDRETRAFGLQVLVGAGSPEAQAAMREVLASPEVRASEHRGWLTLQLALVEHPTPETVAFADATWREARGPFQFDAALVVGATAGRLERHGGAPQAVLDDLHQSLRDARSDAERVALLRSLGNAGVERLVPSVLAFVDEKSPSVRRAAADALRKTATPEARRALERLALDSDVDVQVEALVTLARFPLEAETLAHLQDGVTSGRLRPGSVNALVTLLAPHVETSPAARQTLEVLLRRPAADPSIHTRIRGLLGEPL